MFPSRQHERAEPGATSFCPLLAASASERGTRNPESEPLAVASGATPISSRVVIAVDLDHAADDVIRSGLATLGVVSGAGLPRPNCSEVVLVHVVPIRGGRDPEAEQMHGPPTRLRHPMDRLLDGKSQLHRLTNECVEVDVPRREIVTAADSVGVEVARIAERYEARVIVAGRPRAAIEQSSDGQGHELADHAACDILVHAPCAVVFVPIEAR